MRYNQHMTTSKEVAVLEPTASSVQLVSIARQMLEEAKTLDDMRTAKTYGEMLRTGLKSRGDGIEAENLAAEVVIRAERAMGAELIRMAQTGERLPEGGKEVARLRTTVGNQHGQWTRADAEADAAHPLTLSDLGISSRQSFDWQALARLPDDQFNLVIAQLLVEQGKRLARIDIYRRVADLMGKDAIGWDDPEPETEKPKKPKLFRPSKADPEPEPEAPNIPVPPSRPNVGPIQASDSWTEPWARFVELGAVLAEQLAHGWPTEADRTRDGWSQIDTEINGVGRVLLAFQKKVKSYL